VTRTIFLQEFKRALFQAAIVLFPIFVALSIVERVILSSASVRASMAQVFSGTPDAVVDALISVLILISAFAFGLGAFLRLADRHITFVHSLPITRVQVWTTILAANVAAAVSTTAVLFIVRPSLWTVTDVPTIGNRWPYSVGLYIVLFAGGCCFAMLFRNVATRAVAGILVVGASAVITAVFAGLPRGAAGARLYYGIPVSGLNRMDPGFWLLWCLVLGFIYLGLSLRFFIGGEFALPATRLRNVMLLAFLLLLYPILLSAGFQVELFGKTEYAGFEPLVSRDGQFLALVERQYNREVFGKIVFVDARTGRQTGTYESYGIHFAWWSNSEPVLNVIMIESPLRRLGFALPPSDFILRLSPDAKEAGRIQFGFAEFQEGSLDEAGRMLAVVKTRGENRLFEISDGTKNELMGLPSDYPVSVRPWTNAFVVFAIPDRNAQSEPLQLDKVWSIRPAIRPIGWLQTEKVRTRDAFILDGQLYSQQTVTAEVERRFPLEGNNVRYYMGHSSRTFPAFFFSPQPSSVGVTSLVTNHVFASAVDLASARRRLFVYDPHDPQAVNWKLLTDNLPINTLRATTPNQISRTIVGSIENFADRACVDADDGLAIFPAMSGSTDSVEFYDVNTGQTRNISDHLLAETFACAFLKISGFDGMLINIYDRHGFAAVFQYKAGDLKRIPLGRQQLIYWNPDGRAIYVGGRQIFSRGSDGQERRIWPPN